MFGTLNTGIRRNNAPAHALSAKSRLADDQEGTFGVTRTLKPSQKFIN